MKTQEINQECLELETDVESSDFQHRVEPSQSTNFQIMLNYLL